MHRPPNIMSKINEVSVVYEDNDFVIINKPSGLITHPKNEFDHQESVTEWLVKKYPSAKSVGTDPLRPGVVHRLDRETSGLLILAKTPESFEYFKNLFKSRDIKKTYVALVYGKVKNNEGTVDTPVARLGVLRTTRMLGKRILKGQEAVTDYKVLERYEDYTLVEATPITGRTHQIRLHMKYIGHTVVCDRLYRSKSMTCPPELGRLFLHAKKLSFTSPSGESLTIETDLSPELSEFLKTLPKS
ncbi:MAG: RluA family pseudouridine synthase [Candidatus Paceibacterota bacterium]